MSEPIRVTQVLDFFKEDWYVNWVCRVGKREANRIGKAAMKIGSRVDELIKEKPLFDIVVAPKDKEEIKNCLLAYRKWRDIYKPISIIPCSRLYATIDGVEVTGEPDLMVDDVLVDIKCSTKISLKYWVQVMMYRRLQNIVGPVAILRLDKVTGSFEYVVKDYDWSLVKVWVGMMRAMLYLQGEEADDNDGE